MELVGSPYLLMSVWLSTHNTKHFLFQSVAKLCLTHLGLSQRNRVKKPIHTSKKVQFIFQRKISQGFTLPDSQTLSLQEASSNLTRSRKQNILSIFSGFSIQCLQIVLRRPSQFQQNQQKPQLPTMSDSLSLQSNNSENML